MIEEAAILRRDQRVDEVRRQLVEGHGVIVTDAATPDLLAVAVEEGDREVLLLQPVFGSQFEGRDRQREQHEAAGDRQGEGFAAGLDGDPLQAGDMEALHVQREAFVAARRAVPAAPDGGIDPGVEREHGAPHALQPRRALQPLDIGATRLDPRTAPLEPCGRRVDPGADQPADEPVRELLQNGATLGTGRS